MSKFSSFNLTPMMVDALSALGYKEPSPVQERIIPNALKGESLICQSETGSGKTHAFLVPLLSRLDRNDKSLQAIIIAPSVELARQIFGFANELIKQLGWQISTKLYSSESEKESNIGTLCPQLAVGTPGRLKDVLSDEYHFNLHSVRMLVLDEADMLMELGYFDEVDSLFEKLPTDIQTLVFSATLNQGLREKLAKYIGSSFVYQGSKNKTGSNVSHHLIDIRHADKLSALESFLRIKNPYLCLCFASKKEDVRTLFEGLRQDGFDAVMFSGDLDTRKRKQTLRLIKENKFQIIVSSDLLSRGIDIEDVTDVVSVDLPHDLSYYYHRAGRTGRFFKKGDSYVFYDSDHSSLAKQLIDRGVVFDFFVLKNGNLSVDTVGLLPKKKFTKKKELPSEEMLEIKKAKALTRNKKVKPAYKKKRKWAIERVKGKYRRKAISKAISKSKKNKTK